MPTPFRRIALAIVAVLLVSACGPVLGSGQGGEDAQAGVESTVPSAAEVAAISDPRSWQGEIVMNLPDPAIEPVSADPQPQLPVTVTDNQGTRVEVTDVSRILALDIYGTLSRTVFELGLGDNLVGRDTSSAYAEASDLPLVTQNGHELQSEAILGLDPTIVLTDTSLGPFNVILQLREAGIPVVVVDSTRSLDNVGSLTQEIADALGVSAEGEQLAAELEAEVAEATADIEALAPAETNSRLRTIFLYVRGQAGVYYLFGKDSGADTLISAAGGYDVADEIGWDGMRPVSDEGLIAAQPDVIVMMNKGLESVDGVDGLLDRFPSLATTPAGQNRRIIAMDDTQVLSFGPQTAQVLNALAVAMYAPGEIGEGLTGVDEDESEVVLFP